jgi:hypothetical protein
MIEHAIGVMTDRYNVRIIHSVHCSGFGSYVQGPRTAAGEVVMPRCIGPSAPAGLENRRAFFCLQVSTTPGEEPRNAIGRMDSGWAFCYFFSFSILLHHQKQIQRKR